MTKYQTQATDIQRYLASGQNILIALPASLGADELASGLALYLALEQAGKQVAIITEGVVTVGNTNLFGVGQVHNKLPHSTGGNLTIVLGGVVDPNTKLPPTLQELKYFPEGSDLHLVFYPLQGQRFEPTHITPRYDQVSYDLIFSIGAFSLSHLGRIYSDNQQIFSSGKVINIDNKAGNTLFGLVNIVDQQASSLSEMVYQLMADLKLPLNGDVLSNILAGVYSATGNLQGANVSADTFEVIAQAIKGGGQRPGSSVGVNNVAAQTMSQPASSTFSSLFSQPVQPQPSQPQAQPQPSVEEVPLAEQAVTPGEDWLTPKIYRGTTLG